MNSRKYLVLIAAAMAVLAVACGTGAPASSPTPDVTPTAVPIDLINADLATDSTAFRASLSASEAECYDGVEAYESGNAWGFPKQNGPVGYLPVSDDSVSMKALHCYDNDTLQRLYIGQVDRLSGGLSNASLNCMVEHTANTNFSGLIAGDDDALQPDNLISVVQSIFCLNDEERLAFETSLAAEDEEFRAGMIDGLECTFDYQDDGRFVVQDAIALFSLLSGNDPVDEETGEIRPEVREAIGSIFDIVPVVVECGLVTDEDLAESGLTADQLVCASNSLREPLLALMDSMSENPEAEMDFGVLGGLFAALDECDIDLNDIEGMESLFGAGMDGGFGFDDGMSEVEPAVPGDGMSLDDLEEFLTAEQVACLEANLTEADIQLMIETGEPPASMFALMGTCNITLDQFIEGF